MHTLEQLQSGALTGTTHLKLSCGLTHFPMEILQLADTLEVLDLSGNSLTALPQEFARLTKLRIVFLSNNPFTELPVVLGRCGHLEMIGFKACQIETVPENSIPASCRWLILTDNKITHLPASIGNCTQMQKLMLAGNRLQALPQELANCKNLELLRISANQLQQLPDWLFNLPKLAWLAFAGNPCSASNLAQHKVQTTNWNHLGIEEQLGEGASGIIYKAKVKPETNPILPEEVAVKVFKGSVTSDGLPEDEINASLVAGAHPNLVETLAILTGHPEKKQGLVMGLIPEGFSNLGGPPSFSTITRDTFPPGTTFTLPHVLTIARGIASVLVHLQAKGVLHGDVYAHNTLVNKHGNPLFGDFGAATVFDNTKAPLAVNLERVEVRAFGCLLDDLLQHLAPVPAEDSQTVKALKSLRDQCLQTDLIQRPSFLEIETSLTDI
ncbi:protein kinase [Rufibacter sp. DG15C]|uniref:leucine-rich repeat-containing protein kinase family protein n=1 Tax=Rufibacter sp. DG15C TaxID=1379909 RepID=UPI00078DAE30|nr:leucine-rich repeat-containing protein kinase family protein [Rufibacter sp. DG15C]AMM52924.1 protein kinase [Rufibacter sp. DG15C]